MRPYCVGLTGGVGCGKSSAAEIFAQLGAGVVDTDSIAHDLTAAGGAALPAIRAAFGGDFFGAGGELNRPAMRERVFADPLARQRLEAILHPMIRAEATRQVLSAHSGYVVLVVPLLAEHLTDYRDLVDRIAVVDCDKSQQLQRILNRSELSRDQAEAMIAAQIGREARLGIADDIIDNRDDLGVLAGHVATLHALYRRVGSVRTDPASPDDSLQ